MTRPESPLPASRSLVFLGDSLTAGYRLAPEEAFPSLIQARLDAEGHPWRVVNAGLSRDRSDGGLQRLRELYRRLEVDLLFVCLGANDAFQGVPAAQLEANLHAIVDLARTRGSAVMLAGMELPSFLGAYGAAFNAVFPRVARTHGLPFLPFLLEGVALVPELNLPDGVHPNAQGHVRIAEHVWKVLAPALVEAA